jgi:hypothetical protein
MIRIATARSGAAVVAVQAEDSQFLGREGALVGRVKGSRGGWADTSRDSGVAMTRPPAYLIAPASRRRLENVVVARFLSAPDR